MPLPGRSSSGMLSFACLFAGPGAWMWRSHPPGWLVLTYLLQLFTQAQASYPALVSLWRTRCRAGIIRPGAVGKWQPTLVFLLGKSHGQRSSRLQSLGSQRRRTGLSDSTTAATNAEERRMSRAQTPAVPFLFHPVSLCRLPPLPKPAPT